MTNAIQPHIAEERRWLTQAIDRVPVFISNMSHPDNDNLYKFCLRGDLQTEPSLASSVFVTKIKYMLNIIDDSDILNLGKHILSFQNSDGSISDPWVYDNSKFGRIVDAVKSRSIANLYNEATKRAETRQAFAALHALSLFPSYPLMKIPTKESELYNYIHELNWHRPWAAASHLSHLVFFINIHSKTFGLSFDLTGEEVIDYIEKKYRNPDGSWHIKGARVSANQKINGAMKMIIAHQSCGIQSIINPEGLIDICLAAVNSGHACNHFNIICVLNYCTRITNYKKNLVAEFMINRVAMYRDHYHHTTYGFSFHPNKSSTNYYNARISQGLNVPDIHGTFLMTWGLILIGKSLGWISEDKARLPIT